MGAYKDKNGTWYAQFRFTNWKGEPDRKTKRGFATKREALDWERDFLTQSSGNLEMTFEAFYELYKKNMKERIKLSTWNMKESVIEGKILPFFKRKRMCDIKPRDVVEWQNTWVCPKFCVNTAGQCKTEQKFFKAGAAPAAAALSTK